MIIQLPNGESWEFPDGTPDSVIKSSIQRNYKPSDEDIYNQASTDPDFVASRMTPAHYQQYRAHKSTIPKQRLKNFGTGLMTVGGEVLGAIGSIVTDPIDTLTSIPRAGVVGTRDLWEMGTDILRLDAPDTYEEFLNGRRPTNTLRLEFDRAIGKDFTRFKETNQWMQKREEIILGADDPAATRGLANILDPSLLIPGAGLYGKGAALGAKAEAMALKAAARGGTALGATGRAVTAAAHLPENAVAAVTRAATQSAAAAEQARQVVAQGARVGLGADIAGITIPIPGVHTVSGAVAGGKMVGGAIEVAGETVTHISNSLLGGASRLSPLERLAADTAASPGARAFGRVGAYLGLDTAAGIGYSGFKGGAFGSAIGGGLGALAFGIDSDEMWQAAGGGTALGGVAGVGARAIEKATGIEYRANTAADFERFVHGRPDEAQWRKHAENSSAKQLAADMDLASQGLRKGAAVVFVDKDTMPTDPRLKGATGFAAVLVEGDIDGVKAAPVIYVNVDAKGVREHGVAHELFHYLKTDATLNEFGKTLLGEVINGVQVRPRTLSDAEFTQFAIKYIERFGKGTKVRAEYEEKLRILSDPTSTKEARLEVQNFFVDELGAFYTQSWVQAQRRDAFLPGKINSVYAQLFQLAYDKVAARFSLDAQRNGFDFSKGIESGIGSGRARVVSKSMDETLKKMFAPQGGIFEPSITKVTIGKDLKAGTPLIRALGLERDYVWDSTNTYAIREKTRAEIKIEDDADAKTVMDRLDAVPADKRGGERVISDERGSKGQPTWVFDQQRPPTPEQIDAILESGVYSDAQKATIRQILSGLADGSVSRVGYLKASERGQFGVFPHTTREMRPYAVQINLAKLLYIKALDVSKVRGQFNAAYGRPEYHGLFADRDAAWHLFTETYLKNLADPSSRPSAEALGGGSQGEARRNFFYEVLGTVPRKGQSLLNPARDGYTPSRRGGSVVESFRPERITTIDPTPDKIAFNDTLVYPRAQINYLPDFGDAVRAGGTEVSRHPFGAWIAKVVGGRHRLYGVDGDLMGVFETRAEAAAAFSDSQPKLAETEGATSIQFLPEDIVALLSASATGSTEKFIQGILELGRRAETEPRAATILSAVAIQHATALFSGIDGVVVGGKQTYGVWGSGHEASAKLSVQLDSAQRPEVLAALERFAAAYKQQAFHTIENANDGAQDFTPAGGGLVNVPMFRFRMNVPLSLVELKKLVAKSNIAGITVDGRDIITYYGGSITNGIDIKNFFTATASLSRHLGKTGNVEKIRVSTIKLGTYGHNQSVGFSKIRGPVPTPVDSTKNKAAHLIAKYLSNRKISTRIAAKLWLGNVARDGAQTAVAYGQMIVNNLDDSFVARCYSDLAKEVKQQFELLPINVEVWNKVDTQPYANSQAMRNDVIHNNHLYIFKTTKETFGPADSGFDGHPLLEDSGHSDVNGVPLLVNDELRAVHDFYAHTMQGNEFGPRGEEVAALIHAEMTVSPFARLALMSETRGQNSYVNYGPDAAHNRADPGNTRYAVQKADILPEAHTRTGVPHLDAETRKIYKDRARYMPEGDSRYLELAKEPEKNRGLLQRMVDAAAKAAGYVIDAMHGTKSDFDVFDKAHGGANVNRWSSIRAFWFSDNDGIAQFYGDQSKRIGSIPEPITELPAGSEVFSYKIGKFEHWDTKLPDGTELKASSSTKEGAGKNALKELNRRKETTRSAKVLNTKLQINNPLRLDASKRAWDVSNAVNRAIKEGRDGVIISNIGGVLHPVGTFYGVFDPSQIKSADPITRDAQGNVIPLSQRFNKGSSDIRYMPYAGESATPPQLMRDSLDTAKAMAAAGKASEVIRAITGWFPGKYDGKMRFEVPDEGALIKTAIVTDDGKYRGTLGGALAHPELFRAYPDAAKVAVDITIDASSPPKGSFQRASVNGEPLNSATEITVIAPNYESLKSVLLHEIQHLIQEKEGFAKGGDWRMAFADPRMGIGSKEGFRAATRILKRILGNVQKSLSIEEFAKQAWPESASITSEIKASYKDYLATKKKVASDLGLERIAQETAAKEWYRNLAGEIESRDVQARRNFTPEQRKAVAPYSSENIAKEDSIVLSGGARFLPEGDDSQPAFYSRLTRSVEQSQQSKASGSQWKATVKNSKLGANADEYALVGVGDLEDGKIYTKAEVLDYLRANEVVVKVVAMGGELSSEAKSRFDAIEARLKTLNEEVKENRRRGRAGLITFEEQRDARRNLTEKEIELDDEMFELKSQRRTHFSQPDLQLPGAVEGSYREVQLSSPNEKAPRGFNVFERTPGEGWYVISPDGIELGTWMTRRAAIDSQRNQPGSGNWRDGHEAYSSIANPIVRLRLNEHTDPDFVKTDKFEHDMMLLEEVQPPQGDHWHEVGGKKFENAGSFERATAYAKEHGGTVVAKHSGEFAKMPKLFKDKWQDIAFRWALRHAVENKYRRFGWTTGEQQAARYNLSKQVEQIVVRQKVNQTTDVQTRSVFIQVAAGDGQITLEVNNDGIIDTSDASHRGLIGKRLDEVIGKDMSQKIMDAKSGTIFSGEDLKVGGEGLIHLYNVKFRNVVNSLPAVKKAGQKVGMAEVSTSFRPPAARAKKSGIGSWNVFTANGYQIEGNWFAHTADEAIKNANSREGVGETSDAVHSLDITPAIRESVMGGQARFLPEDARMESGTVGPDAKVKSIPTSGTAIPWSRSFLPQSDWMRDLPFITDEMLADIERKTSSVGVIYADRMRVGSYNGHVLQGGVGFPGIPEYHKKGIVWAVNGAGMHTMLLRRAALNGGYMKLVLMAEGNVIGNKTFAGIWFSELRNNISSAKDGITPHKALLELNAVRRSGVRKDTGHKKRWRTLEDAERDIVGMSQKGRAGVYFTKSTNKTTGRTYGALLTQAMTKSGFPDAKKIVDGIEEPAFKGIPTDAVVALIKLDPHDGGQPATPQSEGVTPHGSYGFFLKGKFEGWSKFYTLLHETLPLVVAPMVRQATNYPFPESFPSSGPEARRVSRYFEMLNDPGR